MATAELIRVAAPPMNDGELNQHVREYAEASVFRKLGQPWLEDNPFRRPLLNNSFDGFDTAVPLEISQIRSNASLVANRVLMSIYERDFVFLPTRSLESKWDDFQIYYSDELRLKGEAVRPQLERYVFSSAEREIQLSGTWSLEAFEAYFDDFRKNLTASDNARLMTAITSAHNPVSAAHTYLIQLAGDFLVESSAMARNAIGNYGQLQSELFKVVIDECGYGVHSTKHSTLFQKVMESQNLDPVPHTYWQFYLPTSLYLFNYYNYICRDHRHLFRYIGAILQVETSFGVTCKQMADMMRSVFGPNAETDYFLEHVHIDNHHSRMVFEDLVRPSVKIYGNAALHDILRGFEESLLIGAAATAGMLSQITWADSLEAKQGENQKDETRPLRLAPLTQPAPDRRWEGTWMSDEETTYTVKAGELDVVAGYGTVATFGAGQHTRIPAGILYSIRTSSDCVFDTATNGAKL